MCPLVDKVKTKGSQKGYAGKFEQSTKSLPSFFEHVDALHFVDDSSSTWRSPSTLSQQPARMRKIPTLDQFHVNFHPYISNIVEFTWPNGRKGCKYVSLRLDRSIYNDEAFNFWSSINCNTLTKVSSDHFLLVTPATPNMCVCVCVCV